MAMTKMEYRALMKEIAQKVADDMVRERRGTMTEDEWQDYLAAKEADQKSLDTTS